MAKAHPVPSNEEKEAMSASLLAEMKIIDDAKALLDQARAAVGEQFAEVGNSDKMEYTDRDTGLVQKWGISAEKMAAWAKAKEAAVNAAVKALQTLSK